MDLRELQPPDIDVFVSHVARQMGESGFGDTPIFAPYEPGEPWGSPAKRAEILGRWQKSLSDTGWERAWGIFVEGRIVAHLDLRGETLHTARHRAVLGMGVEASHRGKGYGRALIERAIEWGRATQTLAWIDLFVFAHNRPARALYQKAGFEENGYRRDYCRIAGQSIDDVSMSFDLTPRP